ncbi:MAG: hypothetical protein ACK4FN_03835, partial [Acinetobacter johnsonii]
PVIARAESNAEAIANFFMVCTPRKWNCISLIFCYKFSLGQNKKASTKGKLPLCCKRKLM